MTPSKLFLSLFSLALLSPLPSFADANKQSCMYLSDSGTTLVVDSKEKVPIRHRATAKCVTGKIQSYMAKPDEIKLTGTVRQERINSALGPIDLRWPRSAESIFGRTPLRATVDAASTVSKATRTAAFPSFIQNLNIPWNIVFMDEKIPVSQVPANLISNCHPGWMIPPADIYIVAQRVAAGCGGGQSVSTSVADAQLAEVLVHEMGHAIEFQLMGNFPQQERMRAEGFATWFEGFAAQYSSLLNRREIESRTRDMAAFSVKQEPGIFQFSGSALDYARASMYFSALEQRFGLRGIVAVYERMSSARLDFFSAIQREHSWNRQRLEEEVLKVVGKK